MILKLQQKNIQNKLFIHIKTKQGNDKCIFKHITELILTFLNQVIKKSCIFNSLIDIKEQDKNTIKMLNENNLIDLIKLTNISCYQKIDLDDEILFHIFNLIKENKTNLQQFKEMISAIIDLLNSLLYTQPYNILFGKIPMKKQSDFQDDQKRKLIKPINQFFYEGIGNDIFKH